MRRMENQMDYRKSQKMSKFAALWLFVANMPLAVLSACPADSQRFELNADAKEVADKHNGLIWARCSVGQSWNGATCTGEAQRMTHDDAIALANNLKGWRLPDVKELAELADLGCQNPAIDRQMFPNTPSELFWSSTRYAANPNSAWVVKFNYGTVDYDLRFMSNHVRLVRTGH